jgi:outer membrane protein
MFCRFTIHSSRSTICLLLALLAAAPASAQESPPANLPVVTIGEALRAALERNPDLANAVDILATSQIAERGVASTFLPQVTPFFSTDRSRDSSQRTESYGIIASELFPFGTQLDGQTSVTRSPGDSLDNPYGSDYRLTLTQPLLRGADPAVTREPLRQAKRSVSGSARALEVLRRRTVQLVYQAYLGVAREQEALRLAAERRQRSETLTDFSRARFQAGSLSRLDVLRAEQQEASTEVAMNDAANLGEDLRDALRRAAGLGRDLRFAIRPPEELPLPEPPEDAAVEGVLDRRPEALEARDQITDADFAVRIARSLQLPSLQGVATYEAFNTGPTAGDALRPRNPTFLFGLRSQYGLNATLLYAQRREAEIALEGRRRNYRLLEDDLVREVRQAYRRLDQARRNHEIAARNEEVAQLQMNVAQLRFEKGLSDNFNVVDAENLLNSARLFELDSRFDILLARLNCLFASGRLEVAPFLGQP